MTIQKPAMRLPRRALPLAAALLLASLPLLARQEFSRPSDSSDFGPHPAADSYTFEAPSEPSAAEPSAPSEPSEPSTPSEPSVSDEPATPSEPNAASEDPSPEPIVIAQQRSRPSDSSDTGRSAHEIGSHSTSSSHSSPPSTSGSGSSSSDSGRTARPVGPGDDGPHRQPPTHGSHSHHGGGSHGGGYYYPYGYYGYGFWPGFSWWWGGWWDYPYYPYGYEYGQPRYYGRGGDVGALDFDVSPARTEIYLDGQYVGKVDGFDGWPRYLWLPKGTYDVVLYLDGFKTIARQITVYPGSVIDLDDRMEPGDSVRPEDLASKSHERRDERLGYERERRERLERGERGDDEGDWRDRVRRERGYRPDDHSMRDDDDDEEEETADARGRLRLDVDPEDASVYLDGRFVGTASELALMRGGLPVSPGEHKLAVVRPGRKAEEREFQVEAGEEVELEVNLGADSR